MNETLNIPVETNEQCIYCGANTDLFETESVFSGKKEVLTRDNNGNPFYFSTPETRHRIFYCPSCSQEKSETIEKQKPYERLWGILFIVFGVIALIGCYWLVIFLTSDIGGDDMPALLGFILLFLPCIPGIILIAKAVGKLKRGFKDSKALFITDTVSEGKAAVIKKVSEKYSGVEYFVCDKIELSKIMQNNNRVIAVKNKQSGA